MGSGPRPRGTHAPVHLTILSRRSAIYTTRRLAEAARLRGARVRVVDPLRVELHLEPGAPAALFGKKPLPRTDVVIPRIAPSIQAYGLAVLDHFGKLRELGITWIDVSIPDLADLAAFDLIGSRLVPEMGKL